MLSLAAKESSYRSTLPHQAWEVVRRLVDEDMGSLVYDFLDVTKVTDAIPIFFLRFWFHLVVFGFSQFYCMGGTLCQCHGIRSHCITALFGYFVFGCLRVWLDPFGYI